MDCTSSFCSERKVGVFVRCQKKQNGHILIYCKSLDSTIRKEGRKAFRLNRQNGNHSKAIRFKPDC